MICAEEGAAWTRVPAWLFTLPAWFHQSPVGGQANGGLEHWDGLSVPVPPPPQLLLMERKLQEVHPLLTLCGQIVENWQGNPIQKESLRVFFLVLQVTHYLDAGQVCSASHSKAGGSGQAVRGPGTEIPILFLPPVPHHAVHLTQGLASLITLIMLWHKCCAPEGRRCPESGLSS